MTDGSLGTWRARSIVATMMPILVVMSVLEMSSGVVLEGLKETFVGNPTLLVIVPVMIGMGGNLGAILSSRLSTRLHLGTLSFSVRDSAILASVVAVVALGATVFALMGVAAWGIGFLIGSELTLATVMTISLVSGMLLAVVAIALSISMTYASYRLGLDPDDTTIPVVTNLCDILGVVILSGVALFVL